MKTKMLMVLALSMSFQTAFAQTQGEEQVLNSAPINVDGYLAEDRPVTDGELEQIKGEIRKQKTEVQLNKEKSKGFKELSKQTEKLSEVTEEYLDEKKDATKEIAEYNAKIKCLMEENPGKDCDKYTRNRKEEVVEQPVSIAQAAPAVEVVSSTELTPFSANGAFEQIKLLPYAGATTYSGKVENLEAELAAGLRLESNITSRFSMGIGFNYAQLKTEDFGGNAFGMNGGFGNSNYYGPNAYGQQGREIQFSTMGLDLYSKFFITNGARFRPYLGAALGMNRSTMKYSQNNPYQFNQYSFGDEEYKQTYATGSLMLGTEIMITRGFGINIEGSYSTGLGQSMSSSSARNMTNSPDQARLRDLGREIIDANVLSIFAGAVVIF